MKEKSEKDGLKLSIQKTKIMASDPITSWQIDGETMEMVRYFIFLSSKIIVDGDCSYEIKRCLLLGRKPMTNLDSILKSRDINLLTKAHIVKAMFFPLVRYACESWTIKKVVKVAQSCPTLCNPMDCTGHGFSRPEYWSGSLFPSPGDLLSPRIKHRSRALLVESLPAESQGKPKYTGVGRLSLLQWIFLTQQSNRNLLHCRWILY